MADKHDVNTEKAFSSNEAEVKPIKVKAKRIKKEQITIYSDPSIATSPNATQASDNINAKKPLFGKILIIWALLLIILGAIGCGIFWRYASIYEISRPDLKMLELLSEKTEEEWINLAKDNVNLSLSKFEDPQKLYSEYLDNIELTGNLSFTKELGQSSSDSAAYIIRDGVNSIAEVILIPLNDLGFGCYEWHLGDISSANILASLKSVEVNILAYPDTELYLNGVAVSEDYVTDENYILTDLNSIEENFEIKPACNLYTIPSLYGNLELTDADGNVLSPIESSDSAVTYDVCFGERFGITIFAPDDVDVNIGGYTLPISSSTGKNDNLFKDISDYTNGKEYETLVYTIEGFHSFPEITATDADGNVLTPLITENGGVHFYHENDASLQSEEKQLAEDFFYAYTTYCTTRYSPQKYNVVMGMTLPGSTIYDYMSNSYDTMIWAASTTANYKNLKFSNFSYIGDDCFICTAEYEADLVSKAWQSQKEFSDVNAYEISFVRSGNDWLAANISNLP